MFRTLLPVAALLIAVLITLRATDPAALAPLFAHAVRVAALALLEGLSSAGQEILASG